MPAAEVFRTQNSTCKYSKCTVLAEVQDLQGSLRKKLTSAMLSRFCSEYCAVRTRNKILRVGSLLSQKVKKSREGIMGSLEVGVLLLRTGPQARMQNGAKDDCGTVL